VTRSISPAERSYRVSEIALIYAARQQAGEGADVAARALTPFAVKRSGSGAEPRARSRISRVEAARKSPRARIKICPRGGRRPTRGQRRLGIDR